MPLPMTKSAFTTSTNPKVPKADDAFISSNVLNVTSSSEPAPTMMVLADASALDTTSSGELVAGMTTSLVLVGTPPVQFAAVCQESVGPGPVLKVSTAMTPSMKSRCRQL